MSEQITPVPAGFHTVTPHLVVSDAAAAIAYYAAAFGATEVMRAPTPDGRRLMHAEVQIGDSRVMLMDEFPEFGKPSASTLGGTAVALHLYVEDVDAVFERAVAEGAQPDMPPDDMFWGDRYARVTDPFGHAWAIATRVRNPTPDEVEAGAKAAFSGP